MTIEETRAKVAQWEGMDSRSWLFVLADIRALFDAHDELVAALPLARREALREAAVRCEARAAEYERDVPDASSRAGDLAAEAMGCARAVDALLTASEASGFYILSLKWSRTSECLVWWRPGAAGYTLRLDDAGVFTAEDADAACPAERDDSAAIPVATAHALRSSVVLDSARLRLLAARRPGSVKVGAR